MQFGPLATTSIGSFPRPSWLGLTNRSQVAFRIAGDVLAEALDDATRLVLLDQEALGLDILTDGEQRRTSFIFHVAGAWNNIDTQNLTRKTIYRNRVSEHMVPRIVGKVSHRATSPVVEDLRFAKALTLRPVKMQVPGPMTVIDSSSVESYDREDDLAMDIAAALNIDLLDLQAAGCDLIQIDEPAMTRYHDKVRAYGAAALDRCLEGVTVPTIVHLCYGYPGGEGLQYQYEYGQLLPLLMQTRIGGFTVEFGRSPFDPAILETCGDRLVVFGCVDPGATPAASPDAIKAKLGAVLRHLDPRQVLVAPDCGLMTISRALARDKLQAMVAAARDMRQQIRIG